MNDYFHSCIAIVIRPNGVEEKCNLAPTCGPLCPSHANQYRRGLADRKHMRRILRTSLKYVDADSLADIERYIPHDDYTGPSRLQETLQTRIISILREGDFSAEQLRARLHDRWSGDVSRGQVGAAIRSLKAKGSIGSRYVSREGRKRAVHTLL